MIKHILLDGTVRESMRGFKVPITKETKIAYEAMSNHINNKKKKENVNA